MPTLAVLAPGYGGGPDQRILQVLSVRLAADGVICRAIAFRSQGKRPTKGYAGEIDGVRQGRDALSTERSGPIALVGRSFGGRICTFLAAEEPPAALAVLGYPVAPPGRPRPDDEAALLAVLCPTLIVQGDRGEPGPLPMLKCIAKANHNITLVVIPGAAHSFGRQEGKAIEAVPVWLRRTLAG